MLAHLASFVGLVHAAIVLVVTELLSDLAVHQVSELICAGLRD